MTGATVLSVVGTRPNFMKVAPVVRALEAVSGIRHVLVHTGQHYDERMSDVFLHQLGLPSPDVFLGVGSGSHTAQTARVLSALEPVLGEICPHLVLVPGDVNSTLAAALAARQAQCLIGHIEAGLRSFDRTMPEELNRVLVDQLSDLLFTHSPEARDHLLREGRPAAAVHEVGNTMIDTLVYLRERITATQAPAELGLAGRRYVLVTLHRPALVDTPLLAEAMASLETLCDEFEIVFPVHPRTRSRLEMSGGSQTRRVRLLEPLPYLTFMSLMQHAAAVLTDSGGIQEETTSLGVPCFTLRDNTERPVTIDHGTNQLLGLDPNRIREIPHLLAQETQRENGGPAGWDGRAAERICAVIREELGV